MENNIKSYFEENNEKKMDYLLSLTNKQYQIYNVCENKVNIIATISAIFIGTTILFIDKGKYFNQTINTNLIILILDILILLMLVLFVISLAIMIWYVGPDKIINPKWINIKDTEFLPNHRAIYGIKEFNNIKKYSKYINKLTQENICNQIIKQVYVLNEMIWKMQKIINIAVLLNIIGLFLFILILALYFFIAHGGI
jgi:hypothetical protein